MLRTLETADVIVMCTCNTYQPSGSQSSGGFDVVHRLHACTQARIGLPSALASTHDRFGSPWKHHAVAATALEIVLHPQAKEAGFKVATKGEAIRQLLHAQVEIDEVSIVSAGLVHHIGPRASATGQLEEE